MTTETHNNYTYTAVYTAPEWSTPEPIDPWTIYELVRQMEAVGWVAQPDPGQLHPPQRLQHQYQWAGSLRRSAMDYVGSGADDAAAFLKVTA